MIEVEVHKRELINLIRELKMNHKGDTVATNIIDIDFSEFYSFSSVLIF